MRAALESLLQSRKLDVTLTSFVAAEEPSGLAAAPHDEARVAPIGVPSLDAALGGGLRRGHLSEIIGAPSSGRTTIAVQAFASATARGEAVALVDTCDTFDPESGAAHGVVLSHLLWVRLSTARAGEDAARALKAFSFILQAGSFGVAVFDLAGVAPAALRFPMTTWLRLARIIEGSDTVALLLGDGRLARSSGGVTIACESVTAAWQGTTPRARVFTGIAPAPRVVGGRR